MIKNKIKIYYKYNIMPNWSNFASMEIVSDFYSNIENEPKQIVVLCFCMLVLSTSQYMLYELETKIISPAVEWKN